jgi:hypothetical protein
MHLGRRLGHLTYSTLVHPGDTWDEMRDSLETFVPAVKARVSPTAPFGVSLRLSAASAKTLAEAPAERARLRRWLAEQDMYVFTVNAFPYGPFKGRVVMEQVYEPDWSTDERVGYTCQVADLLAEISPPTVAPSIQSAPLAFRANVRTDEYVPRLTTNLLRAVAHLIALEDRSGRRVKLALEPEPACFLESTEETIAYFRERVWSPEGIRTLCGLTGLPASEAVGRVRRHLGVVFDTCHQSVQFEDVGSALSRLCDAGVPVYKLQAAAAVRVPEVTAAAITALTRFTDTIYLSQTTEARAGQLTRMLNLSDAIGSWRDDPSGHREWRTHFHVPIFLDDLGELGTTRSSIEDALALHAATPVSDHLEVETYTWDVLPAHLKSGDIIDYVTRELRWAIETIDAKSRRVG